MKKIILLLACTSLLSSTTVFAAALGSANTGAVTATDGLSIYGGVDAANALDATTSTLIGKLSKGVRAGVYYNTTGYALNTKHVSGNTAYGTAHDATAIYKSEIGVNTALTAPTAAAYTSFSAWTAM